MELTCLVEIPGGSRNKYEFDEERDIIRLDRCRGRRERVGPVRRSLLASGKS